MSRLAEAEPGFTAGPAIAAFQQTFFRIQPQAGHGDTAAMTRCRIVLEGSEPHGPEGPAQAAARQKATPKANGATSVTSVYRTSAP